MNYRTFLIEKNCGSKETITSETEVDVAYIEDIERIAEEIEDEMLMAEVEKRVANYGGWDKILEHTVSMSDVMDEFNITYEMINNAPDIDYEVSAI
jgi:hypothetical protein